MTPCEPRNGGPNYVSASPGQFRNMELLFLLFVDQFACAAVKWLCGANSRLGTALPAISRGHGDDMALSDVGRQSSATSVQRPHQHVALMTIIVEREVPVPMRDGVMLAADVYRPSQTGRYPVLVQRTPYG